MSSPVPILGSYYRKGSSSKRRRHSPPPVPTRAYRHKNGGVTKVLAPTKMKMGHYKKFMSSRKGDTGKSLQEINKRRVNGGKDMAPNWVNSTGKRQTGARPIKGNEQTRLMNNLKKMQTQRAINEERTRMTKLALNKVKSRTVMNDIHSLRRKVTGYVKRKLNKKDKKSSTRHTTPVFINELKKAQNKVRKRQWTKQMKQERGTSSVRRSNTYNNNKQRVLLNAPAKQKTTTTWGGQKFSSPLNLHKEYLKQIGRILKK